MLISETEIKKLVKKYGSGFLNEKYTHALIIFKGRDDDLNDYHLAMEAIVNRYEKSLWEIIRSVKGFSRKECISKYFGPDCERKEKVIPLKKVWKTAKEAAVELLERKWYLLQIPGSTGIKQSAYEGKLYTPF